MSIMEEKYRTWFCVFTRLYVSLHSVRGEPCGFIADYMEERYKLHPKTEIAKKLRTAGWIRVMLALVVYTAHGFNTCVAIPPAWGLIFDSFAVWCLAIPRFR